MRRTPGRLAVGLTALLAAPLVIPVLFGCTTEQIEGDGGTATPGGALEVGDAAYELCVPAPHGQDVLLGDTLLTNVADVPLTLLDVELVDSSDLELVDAYGVTPLPNPEGGSDLVGLRWADQVEDLPADWRTSIVDRELAPGQSVNLVLHLTDTERGGSLEAARVHYLIDGRRHEQRTLTSLAVSTGRCDGSRPVPTDG